MPCASKDKDNDDTLFYTIEKTDEQQPIQTVTKQLSKRGLDLSAGVGLASFLLGQLDVVTALGVVANLEKKAQYDPQFRTSFPNFLRRNTWFL